MMVLEKILDKLMQDLESFEVHTDEANSNGRPPGKNQYIFFLEDLKQSIKSYREICDEIPDLAYWVTDADWVEFEKIYFDKVINLIKKEGAGSMPSDNVSPKDLEF